MRDMRCNAEFGYKQSICSTTEEYHVKTTENCDRVGRLQGLLSVYRQDETRLNTIKISYKFSN
jgi:hypothetical protein